MSFIEKLKRAKGAIAELVLDDRIPEEKALAQSRFDTCSDCPSLRKPINQCSECGCLMNAKVKIRSARCPLNKW